jgi:plastocyanin
MSRAMKISVFAVMGALFLSAVWAEETKVIDKAATEGSGVQKVEILAGSYFFKPKDIQVKVNVPVEITIKREAGVAPHNIVLQAPEAGITIKEELGTELKVIKFTPTKAGKYPFYCDHRFLFWTHRAKGMEGVLEVTNS